MTGKSVSVLIIFLALVSCVIWQNIYFRDSTGELLAVLDSLESPDDAKMEKLDEVWLKVQDPWRALTEHCCLEDIEENIESLKAFYEHKDIPAYHARLKVLKNNVYNIISRDNLGLSNIL